MALTIVMVLRLIVSVYISSKVALKLIETQSNSTNIILSRITEFKNNNNKPSDSQ